jgi:Fur family ferric uptake transcriptional regulator
LTVNASQKISLHVVCDQLRLPTLQCPQQNHGPSASAWSQELQDKPTMPLPKTEIPGHLQRQLSSRGIRMTSQRRAILSVIETASKHLDASQILRKAQILDASVDRSTVYRTLDLLKRQGMIDELDLLHLNGDGHYYERKLDRDHIHMACLRCGKITEFVSKTFESLKKQLEQDCRFHIVVSRLEVGGYCSGCRH